MLLPKSALRVPAGFGAVALYAMEVLLQATGTRRAPGNGGAGTCIVLTVP
ncbi:hypothetical protein ACIRP0_22005 [Streptomyces sp. NPDC101733]